MLTDDEQRHLDGHRDGRRAAPLAVPWLPPGQGVPLPSRSGQVAGHGKPAAADKPPDTEADTGPDIDVHGEGWRHAVSAHRAWLAAVPIVLVNSVAFCGQLVFLRGHLHWTLGGQILVGVTLESVAVYLAWQAHLALAADDSAMRLRLAAYGFAVVIGTMNYSHYMSHGWRPTFAAVTFGLMSVSSPWLWSVHSRRSSRDALKARGLIEPHAVRLGATRWTWHPWRSARVMFRATWAGENDPARAIALVAAEDSRQDTTADISTDRTADNAPDSQPAMTQDKPQARRGAKAVTGQDKAADILRRNPDLPNAEVAKRARVSPKTVQRARETLKKENADHA